jgi:hypothetical protein
MLPLRASECLTEIGDQIMDAFDSDGESDEIVLDPDRLPFLG